MKKTFGFLFFIILILLGYVCWQIFGPTISAPSNTFFYISQNDSYYDVLNNLKKENILARNYFFNKMAQRAKYSQNIKGGKYKIEDNSSVYSLLKMLKSGKQSPVKLVINKIRVKEDLASKISKNFEIDSITTINFLKNNDSLAKYNLDTNTVLSAIIPNTYELLWNSSIKKIFSKLQTEQEIFWNEKRKSKANKKDITQLQVYIIASIVEEETNKETDKPLIASVYINRLLRGDKLQADPTVKFAMKDFGLKRILYKHLTYPSAYNTYYVAGLPPGPICTPSSKTIDAVLDAPKTNYLFFVAKPEFNGYSNFAETYEQHQIFAKQYQQALNLYLQKKEKSTDTSER